MFRKDEVLALSQGELRPLLDANNQGVYDIGPNGEAVQRQWWPVAERTKYLLERFPPRDGFAIEITHTKSPIDIGTPGRPDVSPSIVFVATLRDSQQRVLASASGLQPIEGYKSFEAGETMVRGRLYEALGLPGDPLGMHGPPPSESSAMARSAIAPAPASTRPTTATPTHRAVAAATTEGETSTPVIPPDAASSVGASVGEIDVAGDAAGPAHTTVGPADSATPTVTAANVTPIDKPSRSRSPVRTPDAIARDGCGVPLVLLQQIHGLALLRKVEGVPASFKNEDEARAYLESLRKSRQAG